jgi:uncharacterized damage-inducible protein DinB
VTEVALLAYLMDDAFQGGGIEASGESQALLINLGSVSEDMWHRRLPGCVRTIASIALHVGGCKVMYADHAFGTRALTWESPEVGPWTPQTAPLAETLSWLRSVHERLMAHVLALDDADLVRPRFANWGELPGTRWLLSMRLQHDTYHAGEINHLRSPLSGEDRSAWQVFEGIPAAGSS